jgi:hypothetical protein
VTTELGGGPGEPISHTLIERLQATAEVLTGSRAAGPDLAAHLRGLGPSARRGLEPGAFGAWLAAEVRSLRAGARSPAFHDWLRAVLPGLLEIEAEILTWLRGVRDPGYPVAQYMSQVSYLDHHVGAVLDGLRERGLYEQTLVVFTSPHGEALGESRAFFHHHCLLEAVLRVPLLIKPATQGAPGPGPAPGTRVGGVMDSIDVFPTVVEGLGLPPVTNLPGVGRWQHVRDGSPVPEHDSFALEMGGAMAALTTPYHVFLKALAPYRLTDRWHWRAGQAGLFRLREPMDYLENLLGAEAGLARFLEERLAAWLTRQGGQGAASVPGQASLLRPAVARVPSGGEFRCAPTQGGRPQN